MAHKIGVDYKINVDKRRIKYYNKSDIEIFTYLSKILLERSIKEKNQQNI